MACPKCGSKEVDEATVDQDPVGNDIRAIVCANPECDHVYAEQDSAGQCMHLNSEKDEIGRYWCAECGEYLGERSPRWYARE